MQIEPQKYELMQNLLKDFREDLAESLSHLVAENALKTKYIDVLSHQMRTPLSGIRMHLELALEDADLKPEIREILDFLHENAVRMIQVLNDIMLAQEIEKGEIKLMREACDVAGLLRDVLTELENEIKKKKIVVEFEAGEEAKGNFDSRKLRVVLFHLILNAIRYSNDEGKVHIGFEKTPKSLRFIVKDEGIGVPKKDQEFIFDRSFRAPNAATLSTDSSGLGLYISEQLVKAHQGDIGFESQEGKGSRFFVELPV